MLIDERFNTLLAASKIGFIKVAKIINQTSGTAEFALFIGGSVVPFYTFVSHFTCAITERFVRDPETLASPDLELSQNFLDAIGYKISSRYTKETKKSMETDVELNMCNAVRSIRELIRSTGDSQKEDLKRLFDVFETALASAETFHIK